MFITAVIQLATFHTGFKCSLPHSIRHDGALPSKFIVLQGGDWFRKTFAIEGAEEAKIRLVFFMEP